MGGFSEFNFQGRRGSAQYKGKTKRLKFGMMSYTLLLRKEKEHYFKYLQIQDKTADYKKARAAVKRLVRKANREASDR